MNTSLRYWAYSTSNRGEALPETIDITGRTVLMAMGDSITVGNNSSVGNNSYIEQFKITQGITTLTNIATSGRGVWNQIVALQAQSFTRSATIISIMAGFNDIRRGGNAAKTLKKIEACYRTAIFKGIFQTATPSGAAAITRTGTINAFACNTVGGAFPTGTLPGNFATNAPAQTANAATWTYGFTGTAFGIQFSCSDDVISNYGTARVYIDDVLVKTINLGEWFDGISDGANDNARGPLAFTWHNLDNVLHSVKIESAGDGNVPVDFFATLQTIPNSAAFLLWEIPYMDDIGYAVAPASSTVLISDEASAVIKAVGDEYRALGYQVAYVRTNDYYVLATGLDTADHIHPNDTGHDQIESAGNAAIA